MKRQVRYGVFESNSSSVHSLTICTDKEYEKWENGEIYKARYDDSFKTRDEVIEELKEEKNWRTGEFYYSDVDWNDTERVNELIRDNGYVTEEEFWDDVDYETFHESYTTPSGDKIIAFGYYGADY